MSAADASTDILDCDVRIFLELEYSQDSFILCYLKTKRETCWVSRTKRNNRTLILESNRNEIWAVNKMS